MSTGVLVPLEEYLATTYHPDREYVDGELVERNVGEYNHSLLQSLVATSINILGASVRPRRFVALTEQRVRVREGADAVRRYRIPDVIVLPAGHRKTPVTIDPPTVAIEILSPDDSLNQIFEKCREYLKLGVPNVWILDPRALRIYTVTDTDVSQITNGIVSFECLGEQVTVDFNPIFAEMDTAYT
jgi:Uma2 family endonuclease